MGLFTNLVQSWKKSSKLRKLQKAISPPNQGLVDLIANASRFPSGALNPRDQALETYLGLCEADAGVNQVMQIEELTRADLKHIYVRLLAAGLGQWVKGHHAALSSIAYVEPLQYCVRAQKRGDNWLEIVSNLMAYWEGRVPQGALLNLVR